MTRAKKRLQRQAPPRQAPDIPPVVQNQVLTTRRDNVVPMIVLIVLPLIYLGSALFSMTNIIGTPFSDAKIQFFYIRLFGFSEVARLFLPLWNPYVV